jgi:hypothetical protein
MAERDDEAALRGSIDAALRRARGQWDGGIAPPIPSADRILLIATLGDATLRIRVPRRGAPERARELIETGWRVEMLDASAAGGATEGSSAAAARPPEEETTTVELPADADLRPPQTPDVALLRQSA